MTEAELALMEEEYGSQCAGHERRLVPEVRRLQRLNGELVEALEALLKPSPTPVGRRAARQKAKAALALAGKP